MASWASLPRRPATSKPSPISTPFTAWMLMKAWARRPSSLRSQWTWLPRPTGTPWAITSITPPRESPALAAALISAMIAASASGSAQRTSEASTSRRWPGVGRRVGSARTGPIWITCEPMSTPRWDRRALATAPAATRAAVSRAEARSSTLRASSKAYFCMPVRSAWPGRGVVRRCAVCPGAGDISSVHLRSHSLLAISIATGEPRVRPWRTPARMVTSSASKRIRGPRP